MVEWKYLFFVERNVVVIIKTVTFIFTIKASIDGFCHHIQCSYSEAECLLKKSVVLAKEACHEFLENSKYKVISLIL